MLKSLKQAFSACSHADLQMARRAQSLQQSCLRAHTVLQMAAAQKELLEEIYSSSARSAASSYSTLEIEANKRAFCHGNVSVPVPGKIGSGSEMGDETASANDCGSKAEHGSWMGLTGVLESETGGMDDDEIAHGILPSSKVSECEAGCVYESVCDHDGGVSTRTPGRDEDDKRGLPGSKGKALSDVCQTKLWRAGDEELDSGVQVVSVTVSNLFHSSTTPTSDEKSTAGGGESDQRDDLSCATESKMHAFRRTRSDDKGAVVCESSSSQVIALMSRDGGLLCQSGSTHIRLTEVSREDSSDDVGLSIPSESIRAQAVQTSSVGETAEFGKRPPSKKITEEHGETTLRPDVRTLQDASPARATTAASCYSTFLAKNARIHRSTSTPTTSEAELEPNVSGSEARYDRNIGLPSVLDLVLMQREKHQHALQEIMLGLEGGTDKVTKVLALIFPN